MPLPRATGRERRALDSDGSIHSRKIGCRRHEIGQIRAVIRNRAGRDGSIPIRDLRHMDSAFEYLELAPAIGSVGGEEIARCVILSARAVVGRKDYERFIENA